MRLPLSGAVRPRTNLSSNLPAWTSLVPLIDFPRVRLMSGHDNGTIDLLCHRKSAGDNRYVADFLAFLSPSRRYHVRSMAYGVPGDATLNQRVPGSSPGAPTKKSHA